MKFLVSLKKDVLMLPNLGLLTHSTQQNQYTDTSSHEGKYSVYCKAPSKENRQLMLKRPELPNVFQGSVFKGNI